MNVHRVNLDFKFILRILPESIATEFKGFFFSPYMEYMPISSHTKGKKYQRKG